MRSQNSPAVYLDTQVRQEIERRHLVDAIITQPNLTQEDHSAFERERKLPFEKRSDEYWLAAAKHLHQQENIRREYSQYPLHPQY